MFLGMAALLILATVPLAAGRLSRLATFHLRALPLLLGALLLQIVMTDVANGAPKAVLSVVHVLTYVAAAVVLWLNRKLPGLPVLALGAGLNAMVITLNGGTLPASASALRAAGIHPGQFANSGVLAHPQLAFLGDTMTTPAFLPFRNVISIGDIVILVGFFVLVHTLCDSFVGDLEERAARTARRVLRSVAQPVRRAATLWQLTLEFRPAAEQSVRRDEGPALSRPFRCGQPPGPVAFRHTVVALPRSPAPSR